MLASVLTWSRGLSASIPVNSAALTASARLPAGKLTVIAWPAASA